MFSRVASIVSSIPFTPSTTWHSSLLSLLYIEILRYYYILSGNCYLRNLVRLAVLTTVIFTPPFLLPLLFSRFTDRRYK
jgi:hypothetical protein